MDAEDGGEGVKVFFAFHFTRDGTLLAAVALVAPGQCVILPL